MLKLSIYIGLTKWSPKLMISLDIGWTCYINEHAIILIKDIYIYIYIYIYIVVPPLEEPEGEVCSIHDTMEVEKPRMTMVLIL